MVRYRQAWATQEEMTAMTTVQQQHCGPSQIPLQQYLADVTGLCVERIMPYGVGHYLFTVYLIGSDIPYRLGNWTKLSLRHTWYHLWDVAHISHKLSPRILPRLRVWNDEVVPVIQSLIDRRHPIFTSYALCVAAYGRHENA